MARECRILSPPGNAFSGRKVASVLCQATERTWGVSRALEGNDQVLPATPTAVAQSPEPAGLFSSSDPEGEKEKCSPSLALLPKLNAIPLSFAFHAFGEPCLKRETRQKSRVREKHGSRARYTYPRSKMAERTLSVLPQHLPSPQPGCKRPQWDFS